MPPLLFIYLVPVLLSNTGVIPSKSPAYEFMGDSILPFFLTVMLLEVNLLVTVRAMGSGLFVMLLGTLGVVVGAPLAFLVVQHGLDPDAWQAFGALAGSWIGGTGNMLAVAQMVGLEEGSPQFGYAVIADNAVYLIWLPIMLGSKNLAGAFHRFTRVPADRIAKMDEVARTLIQDKGKVEMVHLLYLAFLGFLVAAVASALSRHIPAWPAEQALLTASTYKILLVTFLGIALSFTPAKRLPSSHNVAMALLYVFVARMGAQASLEGLAQAPAFLLGAAIWIVIHGLFCLAGAWLLKVDVHSAAIASAANVGGAASAPVVAAYHRESLVPVAILMALLGYALGNPVGLLIVAPLCRWVAGV
jgi:uncharacterized membrane protein